MNTMQELLNSATEPDAKAAANMLRYLYSQPFLSDIKPNATEEQQALFDALSNDFYDLPVSITVGNMTIKLDMSAAVFDGLDDCLKYIIDQQ
jgi:hypothetical protein